MGYSWRRKDEEEEIRNACSTSIKGFNLPPTIEEQAIDECTSEYTEQLKMDKSSCTIDGFIITKTPNSRDAFEESCYTVKKQDVLDQIRNLDGAGVYDLLTKNRSLSLKLWTDANTPSTSDESDRVAELKKKIEAKISFGEIEARNAPDGKTERGFFDWYYKKEVEPLLAELEEAKRAEEARREEIVYTFAYSGRLRSLIESEGGASADIIDTTNIPIEGEFKSDSGDSIVIPYLTEKNKAQGIFQTPKNEKKEGTLTIIKANVQCKDCGWSTEIEDFKTAKKFRRREVFCPNCSSIEFKIENAFPYQIKHPSYSSEEEFRGDLINKIYDKMKWIEVFDCRPEQCPEPYTKGGIQFIPRTGDILLRHADNFHGIEIKFVKLSHRRYKDTNLFFKYIHGFKISSIQLEYIKKGSMILIIAGELIEDFEDYGVTKGLKSELSIIQDIQELRRGYGNDTIPYAYLIIDKGNWGWYQKYFQKLHFQEVIKRGKVTERLKNASFPKLYRLETSSMRYRAVRSKIASEIATRLARKKRLQEAI